MPTLRSKPTATEALVGIWTIALTAFIVATLYLARELLIPLAVATLLVFMLSPLVTRIERRIGRITAVMVVVVLIFSCLGAAAWVFTRQLVDLATKLPEYKGNIVSKMHAFQFPKGGAFKRLSETVEELKKELPGGTAPTAPTITREVGKPDTAVVAPSAAMPVQIVESSKANPMELLQLMVRPLLGPFGTAALVLVLVIFMLLQRENLRGRFIRLIGQGRISATTRAMDDAGTRVSRYLIMQVVVNAIYGAVVAIGLYFIGVPNALLWGALGSVLRFIPYIGSSVATILPTLLALAVSPHWTMPILTFALFILLDLLLNNIVEPWLYGAHTGVSSMALILAAVFWTSLWGPIGLVLATPLTVCLVVMGRHIPRLTFLSVLLGDEEALTPAEDCYHRLLTPGERDEMELVESYLKTNSVSSLYDSVFIPALTFAGTDARADVLDTEQLKNLEQSLRDIIEDLGMSPRVPAQMAAGAVTTGGAESIAPVYGLASDCRVYRLPARADRDELAGAMLVQLLRQHGFGAQNAPSKLVAGELLELIEKADVDVVCISVMPPSTVLHARYLCTKLRSHLPKQKILIGLWGATDELIDAAGRLRESGADEVVTTLADALLKVEKLAPYMGEAVTSPPLPADEEERLAALTELNLLDTEAEPAFDRITAKLARIFEVPIALITLIDRDRQFIKSQVGLPLDLAAARQTPRSVSICGHDVAKNEMLVVEDLARDRRFSNNPLLREHGIRFYVGVPLLAPNGQPIGSLCLLDLKPREFHEREKRLLLEYASEVMQEMGRRRPEHKNANLSTD